MGKKYGKVSGGDAPGPFDLNNIMWWKPSWHEILIFSIAVFFTYWVISIYQYNLVQNKVIQNSRCYKNKQAVKSGGVQYATATNAQNQPMYTVAYNLAGKQTSIECACNTGDVVNNFNNIPVFDLTNNAVTILPTKQCSCDSALLSASPNVYFTGNNGIVKFMNTASVSKNPLTDVMIDKSYFLPTN